MYTAKLSIAALFIGALGCSSATKQEPVAAPAPVMPKPKEVKIENDDDGSLWRAEATTGSFFLDIKASKVGDILTVIVQEEASASHEADTNLKRSAEVQGEIPSLGGVSSVWNKLPFGSLKALTPSIQGSSRNDFMGGGSTSRSENLEARLSVTVTEILPTGNFRIEGQREIKVNNEKQMMRLTGMVRPQDVQIDNTILSSFIADAEIEYSGRGVLSDKQSPGWLARVFDWIWPF